MLMTMMTDKSGQSRRRTRHSCTRGEEDVAGFITTFCDVHNA